MANLMYERVMANPEQTVRCRVFDDAMMIADIYHAMPSTGEKVYVMTVAADGGDGIGCNEFMRDLWETACEVSLKMAIDYIMEDEIGE